MAKIPNKNTGKTSGKVQKHRVLDRYGLLRTSRGLSPQMDVDTAIKWLKSPLLMQRTRALFGLSMQPENASKALPALRELYRKEKIPALKAQIKRITVLIKEKNAK